MGKLDFVLGLRKKEKRLFELYRELGNCVEEAGQAFLVLADDFANAELHALRIHDIEHDADLLKEKVHEILNEVTFLPIDHEDLEQLVGCADDIIDLLWGAADRIANRYHLNDPDPEFPEMAQILAKMTQDVKQLFMNLKNVKHMKNITDQIVVPFHQQENRTDDIRGIVSARRYERARRDPAATIVFNAWEGVIQHLEHAADKCVDISDILNSFQRKYR